MEENKNLVISYSYYGEKENPKEKVILHKIHEALLKAVNDNSLMGEVDKLIHEHTELEENRRITVYKEYPEFLIKDFKTVEELLDFIDDDEPNIYIHRDICFENVPESLSNLGISNKLIDCVSYKDYILARHGEEDD